MILPQTAEYALRAMAWMASVPDDAPMRARDLSRATQIPPPYLAKILRRLVLAGLLTSRKGQGGGFTLARAPEDIRFIDVLAAVDVIPEEGRCAFGWGKCQESDPCPLHHVWVTIRDQFRSWATNTTLAEIRTIQPRG
jgi:Rrf2 family protein